ncbi:MAG TPA: tRNA (adenosine(37)-N6)-dimethylallyltransferase MiaA, partial [Candidatus Krumholzibacteria bacterium]|nr:tRNA (adenosine(37)-N6)-dimethylallyltransferase MiaA [Candidatus Krumholzibacteria bacterium]
PDTDNLAPFGRHLLTTTRDADDTIVDLETGDRRTVAGKVNTDARQRVPHHLLDYLDVNESGSTGRHITAAEAAMRDIASRGKTPFLVGGTGLYFRALFSGLVDVTIPREELEQIRATLEDRETRDLYDELVRRDPARASILSVNDRVRITRALELVMHTATPATELYARQKKAPGDIAYLKLVLSMPREVLRERIAERTRELFDAGWVEEVKALVAGGVSPNAPGMKSLGYADLADALVQREDPAEVFDRVVTITRQYGKRQETFFRSEKDAVWLDMTHADAAERARALVGAFVRPARPQ